MKALAPTLPRKGGGMLAALSLLILTMVAAAAQEPAFPPLSGRVVDAANVLRPEDRAAIEEKLKAHEERTTDQVVVATVPSLGGLTVEDYANRLFRHWRLGRTDKNNGALLLVAPSERRVRIEVGYGLEGALTDALTKVIITTAVAPRFRSGDFAGGVSAGRRRHPVDPDRRRGGMAAPRPHPYRRGAGDRPGRGAARLPRAHIHRRPPDARRPGRASLPPHAPRALDRRSRAGRRRMGRRLVGRRRVVRRRWVERRRRILGRRRLVRRRRRVGELVGC